MCVCRQHSCVQTRMFCLHFQMVDRDLGEQLSHAVQQSNGRSYLFLEVFSYLSSSSWVGIVSSPEESQDNNERDAAIFCSVFILGTVLCVDSNSTKKCLNYLKLDERIQ